ncbi:MAG: hypothetical protein NZU63_07135 [Gemmataceae bacterium]|nr:hypothetical protein [Gemmataceae bacterium]MDW8243475.1 hypothetical protein [Thermogemmata sp.]
MPPMRSGFRWLAGLVVVALPLAGVRAESPRPPKMSLWDKLWSGVSGGSKAAVVRTGNGGRGPIIISPLPDEVKAEALRAEQEAYLRRVAVCLELRRVAVERGDESLYRQAEELERQAEELYRLRVQRLGLQQLTQMPAGATVERNKQTREEEIRAAARRLAPPAPPAPATAEARIREVKP